MPLALGDLRSSFVQNRKIITNFARTLVGSHYLWGSGGACPGELNGSAHRPGSVTWATPSIQPPEFALFAAFCNVKGNYVCAGRFEKVHGHIVAKNDPEFENFVKGIENVQQGLWEAFPRRLTPRRVVGVGVPSAGKIVFGENCLNVRHFDCISFVNYVLTATTNPPGWTHSEKPKQKKGKQIQEWGDWNGSIDNWSTLWTTDVPLKDPAVPGDILIRYYDDEKGRHFSHIALLDDDGHVIQAEMASAGVHADETYVPNPKKWQMRRRLQSQYILDHDSILV